MVNNTLKFIDFIGVDRFVNNTLLLGLVNNTLKILLIVSSYLANLYNYMKTKEKEIQVDFFIPLMSCKNGK